MTLTKTTIYQKDAKLHLQLIGGEGGRGRDAMTRLEKIIVAILYTFVGK